MSCPCEDLPEMPEQPPFTGCDGKVFSNVFLKLILDLAVEGEDYEYAALCRDELKRRKEIIEINK